MHRSPAIKLSQQCGVVLNDNNIVAELGFASLLAATLSKVHAKVNTLCMRFHTQRSIREIPSLWPVHARRLRC